MNLRQGRIGRQETLCAAAIAAAASGIFTPDGRELYAHGNSAYLSMLLSAGLALVAFLFAAGAMRRAGCETLWELLRTGLGGIFGRVAAVLLSILLLFAAASVLSRFSLMLSRFVYPDAAEWQILAYLVPASFLPAWFGLEGVGRAARLFLWFVLAMLLGALVMAAYNYEPHRLAPFLGDGTPHLLDMGARNSLLFFPALVGLLVVARGVHGTVAARRAGYGAGIAAGVLSALCQLCLGMTYPYRDLAQMHSPMYRITMNFRTGGYFPRLDNCCCSGGCCRHAGGGDIIFTLPRGCLRNPSHRRISADGRSVCRVCGSSFNAVARRGGVCGESRRRTIRLWMDHRHSAGNACVGIMRIVPSRRRKGGEGMSRSRIKQAAVALLCVCSLVLSGCMGARSPDEYGYALVIAWIRAKKSPFILVCCCSVGMEVSKAPKATYARWWAWNARICLRRLNS